MERQNVHKYIILWKIVRLFTNIPENSLTKESFLLNIHYIYNYCDEAWFVVSKQTFDEEFWTIYKNITDLSKDDDLLDIETTKLIEQAMSECEKVLDREAKTKSIYELYSQRLPIEKLVDSPLSLLWKTNKLTSISQNDFIDWCKALAYWLRTASAFHFMRVIENLTYEYAKKFWVERSDREMMNAIIIRLWIPTNRTKNERKYDEKIRLELDQIRSHFRNPTQHPDLFYSQSEAENLYYRSIAVISWILNKL